MVATVAVPAEMDRQKPTASLSVTTENLNGQFLPATGTVYIYKLQGPPRPLRKRPWSAPENPVLSRTEFEKMFPNDPYGEDASTPDNWEKGKLIKELSFDTKKSKDLVLAIDNNWKIGAYRIELHTKDSVGQPVEDRATSIQKERKYRTTHSWSFKQTRTATNRERLQKSKWVLLFQMQTSP
jgi:hypothetical protein